MTAYYNEIDPKAAAWIRELIKQGHVAPGEVDERSIADVQPNDLRGFTQCHFFAGIAVWSYALRSAGWSDDRPVWTGSCPCQPFSAAGKGEGYADERHLWPHWNRLISECRPSTIFGEQVDAAIRTGWLDDVCLSLEDLDYAVGAVSFPACSVGAPHIRQRLYFVADPDKNGLTTGTRREFHDAEHHLESRGILGNSAGRGFGIDGGAPRHAGHADKPEQAEFMGDTERDGFRSGRRSNANLSEQPSDRSLSGPTNGFWSAAEWIACRDGKARPIESGVAPLVTGAAARVVKLRGYGNAINAEAAKAFIVAYMEIA